MGPYKSGLFSSAECKTEKKFSNIGARVFKCISKPLINSYPLGRKDVGNWICERKLIPAFYSTAHCSFERGVITYINSRKLLPDTDRLGDIERLPTLLNLFDRRQKCHLSRGAKPGNRALPSFSKPCAKPLKLALVTSATSRNLRPKI